LENKSEKLRAELFDFSIVPALLCCVFVAENEFPKFFTNIFQKSIDFS